MLRAFVTLSASSAEVTYFDGKIFQPRDLTNFFKKGGGPFACLFSRSFPFAFAMSGVQFSIDRPFGVYLYDYFDQAYTAVMGHSATEFAFVEGETPFSTIPEGNARIAAMATKILNTLRV